jgi:molybdopterin-guanine dinucleotide biosynthesis protein A
MNVFSSVILCGGQSTRMGKDKCLIDYHGKPQYQFLFELLSPISQQVFVSCNAAQYNLLDENLQLIVDDKRFENHGPLTGILSVHHQFPNEHLLVIGCDYPLITQEDLFQLSSAFVKENRTIAFRNEEGFIEPLIAIYHNEILRQLSTKEFSLRRFLTEHSIHTLTPHYPHHLKSFDKPDDISKALLKRTD